MNPTTLYPMTQKLRQDISMKIRPIKVTWKKDTAQHDDECAWCGFPFNPGKNIMSENNGHTYCMNGKRLMNTKELRAAQ